MLIFGGTGNALNHNIAQKSRNLTKFKNVYFCFGH